MVILFFRLTVLVTRIESGKLGLRFINRMILGQILALDFLPDLLGRTALSKLIFDIFDFKVCQIERFGVLRREPLLG